MTWLSDSSFTRKSVTMKNFFTRRTIFASVLLSVVWSVPIASVAQVNQPVLVQDAGQKSHFFFERGLEKLKIRHYKSAIAAFTQAINIDPTFTQALSGRGFAHYQLGNLAQAFADYTQIVRIDPNSASGYSGLALVREKLGDREQSAADALKSASLQAKRTTRELYQGELNLLELTQTAAARKTQDANWKLVEQGYQRMNAKDYRGAVALFSQAIGKVPSDNGRPYIDRGIAYFGLQDYRAAIADFSKTIELNPFSLKAFEYRARTYRQIGNTQAAQADLRRARELAQQFGSREYYEILSSQLQQLR